MASVALIAALLAGCGDDDPTDVDQGLTLDDLVGSWISTSVTFTNNANPSETFDLVAAGDERAEERLVKVVAPAYAHALDRPHGVDRLPGADVDPGAAEHPGERDDVVDDRKRR
jgi:hypothetical protein